MASSGTPPPVADDGVVLHVGGSVFEVTRQMMTRYAGSYFAQLLRCVLRALFCCSMSCLTAWCSPASVAQFGRAFVVQRNADMFEHVLAFLRTGQLDNSLGLDELNSLRDDAQFYGMCVGACVLVEKRLRKRFFTGLLDLVGQINVTMALHDQDLVDGDGEPVVFQEHTEVRAVSCAATGRIVF